MTWEEQFSDLVLSLHRALNACGIRHAFGRAIAYGFATDPRATTDVDIDVFSDLENPEDVLRCLEEVGVTIHDTAGAEIQRTGQTRLLFDKTYVDLFFALNEYYHECDRRSREVPWAVVHSIRVLSAEDIVLFKALFNRPKDWLDIRQILLTQNEKFDERVRPSRVLKKGIG